MPQEESNEPVLTGQATQSGLPETTAAPDAPAEAIPAGAAMKSNYLWLGFGAVAVLVLAVIAMVIITSADVAETPPPATLSAPAQEGKALFGAYNCQNCHPAEGRAGGTGPRLSTVGLGDQAIRNIIRRGKGAMPANSKATDEQIDKIVLYLREIKPPATR